MPQHRPKQAGQLPIGRKKQQGHASTAGTEASTNQEASWQRAQGHFSGKAKKEYLKWKRQQKEAAGSDTNDTSSNTIDSCGRAAGDDYADIEHESAGRHESHQQLTAPDGSADDPTQPLQYRPLVAVPAAPFTTAASAACVHGMNSSRRGRDHSTADSSDAVLQADAENVVFMPVLDPAEVGFTAGGFQLTMPTRPAWQGVVHSAEQLHILEEQQFQAWQESMLAKAAQGACSSGSDNDSSTTTGGACASQRTARAGGIGRLSFYEGRLEFWRQLWRTLELSDVVIMIVDARNPLLHFSHALHRHITQDHKLPLLLLLNKCDLVPAAAAAAWQAWLQRQLPGVTVLPVSAAAGEAEAAARQVLEAVLQQRVERGGRQVQVQQLVGKCTDDLIAESLERNVHAKRHVMQPQRLQQDPTTTTTAAAAAAANSRADSTASTPDSDIEQYTDAHTVLVSTHSDDSDNDWSLKPIRRARARKGGRQAGSKSQQQQQFTNSMKNLADKRTGHREAAMAAHQSCARAVAAAVRHQGSESASEQESEVTNGSEHDVDEQLAVMNSMVEDLTLERQLCRTENSSSCSLSAVSIASAGTATTIPAAAAAAAEDAAAAAAWQHYSRPVVIGLLGEPNVGKSSTLNALLGAHRVAVSCHPGRTKHYQTHFMTDKLVLCDCPGIVFPRLDVSLSMQVLFGSYPIASCRQPYAVLRYLASASWPRLQQKLGLRHTAVPAQQQQQYLAGSGLLPPVDGGRATIRQQQQPRGTNCMLGGSKGGNATDGTTASADCAASAEEVAASSCTADVDGAWSPWTLCEALCEKRGWVLPRSGRLDTYRAANWMLRAALGGKQGLGLAFMPPDMNVRL